MSPRRAWLAAGLCWLHQVALAVWLGGIFALGIVAAPAVFGVAKAQGHTDNTHALYRFAGEALGEVFRRFNGVILVAGALTVVAGVVYGLLAGCCSKRLSVRAALSVAAVGFAGHAALALTPPMLAARAAGDWTEFDRLHDVYTLDFKAQAVLLLGILALTAAMHLTRHSRPTGAERS